MRDHPATLIVAVMLALAAAAVYGPYLHNPLLFDDYNLFTLGPFYVAAVTPWEIGPRALPYFTLAFVHTVFGEIWVNRVVSGALHVACGLCLYVWIRDLLRDTAEGHGDARLPALLSALAFVVHPVAVYAAGYLVQRSAVMATLFALLCLIAFRKGLVENRWSPVLWAVAAYALAVISKEHAVLLPAVICALAVLVSRRRNVAALRLTTGFIVLCAPIALWALLEKSSLILTAYEPNVAQMTLESAGLPSWHSDFERWLASAEIQSRLFFRYAALWFWPTTSHMSVDLRIDYAAAAPLSGFPWGLTSFAAAGAVAAGLLFFGRRVLAALGLALAYVWLLYLTELAAIRFQEPFVLYRSYLWAPGYALILALALQRVRTAWIAVPAAAAVAVLAIGAQDRLETFRSGLALWNDAVAKLPSPEVPGARRVFFLRGRELFLRGRYAEALNDADNCVRLAPTNPAMRMARGSALLALGRAREAADEFATAVRLAPSDRDAHALLAIALERLGDRRGAEEATRRAEALGHHGMEDWFAKLRESSAR